VQSGGTPISATLPQERTTGLMISPSLFCMRRSNMKPGFQNSSVKVLRVTSKEECEGSHPLYPSSCADKDNFG
jgi:hypothetical protein